MAHEGGVGMNITEGSFFFLNSHIPYVLLVVREAIYIYTYIYIKKERKKITSRL